MGFRLKFSQQNQSSESSEAFMVHGILFSVPESSLKHANIAQAN